MARYCVSFVCDVKNECEAECGGCQFLYDCEYCNNQSCEHHGKSEDEIEWEDAEQ